MVELGLYGIYHDDALIERHLHDLAELVAPSQIVFNVQTRNPEIEHIARVWVNHEGGRCVWRLRPVEQILEWARGRRLRARGGRRPTASASTASCGSCARTRRHDQRADVGAPPAPPRRSARGAWRALQASHHAMWNYVTYRDAIALVGLDPDDLYPEGTTRLPGRLGRPRLADVLLRAARVGRSRRCAPRSCPTRSTSTRPT